MNIIVFSELRSKFLGKEGDGPEKDGWVFSTLDATPFTTDEAARSEVKRRLMGHTETIVLFRFVCREVSGLRELFTPEARAHYRRKVEWEQAGKTTPLNGPDSALT